MKDQIKKLSREKVTEISKRDWDNPIIYVVPNFPIPSCDIGYLKEAKTPVIFACVYKNRREELTKIVTGGVYSRKFYYCEKVGVSPASLVDYILGKLEKVAVVDIIGGHISLVQFTHVSRTNVFLSTSHHITGNSLRNKYSVKGVEALLLEVTIRDILDKVYISQVLVWDVKFLVKYVTSLEWLDNSTPPTYFNTEGMFCHSFLNPYVEVIKEKFSQLKIKTLSRIPFYK